MSKSTIKRCMVLVALLASILLTLSEARDNPKPKGKKMSFKAPVLNDEAQWSNHVPSTLNCEGCKAITYKINSKLWEFHKSKYPQNKLKSESEVIMAVEGICTSEAFNDYGVKNVKGATKLSGPGLKAADSAGMIMGGGRWPVRLAHRCGELMGEFDEYDIYEMIVKSKGREKQLFKLFCTSESDRKLNSCGGGFDALLEPANYMDEQGKGFKVAKDDEEDDDYDDDDDDDDEL